MKAPLFTFGPTLARIMPHADAYRFIMNAIQARRVSGGVEVAVMKTERPDRFDVEATYHDLSPEQALDALSIAVQRIAALHGVKASTAPAIAADEADALQALAERLVDKIRIVGWWDTFAGFIGAGAKFKYERDLMVRELMRELGHRRALVTTARGHAAAECAANEIPGIMSKAGADA